MANASDHKVPVLKEVAIACIQCEREYQLRRWGYRSSPESKEFTEASHNIFDWFLYIEHYINRAIEKVSRVPGNEAALIEVRKIGALVLAARSKQYDRLPEVVLATVRSPNKFARDRCISWNLMYMKQVFNTMLNQVVRLEHEDVSNNAYIRETLDTLLDQCVWIMMENGAVFRQFELVKNERDGLPA